MTTSPAKATQTSSTFRMECATTLPPVLEALGLAEVEHHPRNNRVRALGKQR